MAKEKTAKEMPKTKELATVGLSKVKGGASGFMTFIKEQNVVGLAVGLVLGTAAGALVNSLINNVIMPPLGFLLGSAEGMPQNQGLYPFPLPLRLRPLLLRRGRCRRRRHQGLDGCSWYNSIW